MDDGKNATQQAIEHIREKGYAEKIPGQERTDLPDRCCLRQGPESGSGQGGPVLIADRGGRLVVELIHGSINHGPHDHAPKAPRFTWLPWTGTGQVGHGSRPGNRWFQGPFAAAGHWPI